jgi:hypothetical protein
MYSECVLVASAIHHAKRVRRSILRSVASLTLPYSPTLFHDFWKEIIQHAIMCLNFHHKFCLKHSSLQEEFSGILCVLVFI